MLAELTEERVLDYLNKKLDQGHHEYVHKFSSYWGEKGHIKIFGPLYDASWRIQERLINEFGYYRCPSCQWAVDRLDLDNHFQENSFCTNNILAGFFLEESDE